ncbi:uncharacterized protein LOC123404182 [Hordeum vulgare subsp. vulgare]|uniref:uncharacterized protein LOC123404182 n=1 Tax=Hordeum vulgare subsp. vulgare TaxID=112509 RepID=UPI001D1A533D|nr:uncharacterized protein LOC123404182 [Hordeum vulgare subsp. vulgare]
MARGSPEGTQRGWGDLPRDLIERIVNNYLPCGIDRLRVSWINSHWGQSIRDMKLTQLPWMFLPSSSTPMFFEPVAQCLHKIWLPAELKSGQACGSSGPWVFISIHEPEHQFLLYNVCNGEKVDLPVKILDKERLIQDAWFGMAALSRLPSTAGGYMVAAVVRINQSHDFTIATWEFKEEHWKEIASVEDGVLDILFYQGSFHILTVNEHLIRLVPEGPSYRVRMSYVEQRLTKHVDDQYEDPEDDTLLRKYLVESITGHLLLALKFTRDSSTTVDIQVFRLCVDNAGKAIWAYYTNTAGEMIYLGQASSISRVSQSEPTIHFLDDRRVEGDDDSHYNRRDMGGLQPHVLQVDWYSYRTPKKDSRFSYRAPDDIGETDVPTPVWCEPLSGGSTT